jgi:hypothetical protein
MSAIGTLSSSTPASSNTLTLARDHDHLALAEPVVFFGHQVGDLADQNLVRVRRCFF